MIEQEKIQEFNKALINKKLTIVCAESITAGLLASTIASIPGASSILKGSIVTYSRDFKSEILKVDARIIDDYTAESMETTVEMVNGLIKIFQSADIYVAVTGIASQGTAEYPISGKVGDIFVAIYYKNASPCDRLTKSEFKITETAERNEIREIAVLRIFETVLEIIK